MKLRVGITLVALTVAGAASASPGLQARSGPPAHQHDRSSAHALRDPVTTGSLAGPVGRMRGARDRQGRDLRSSTRGNAEFPSRLPAQQNLGGTAGGPAF
ncbi:hypothetical protein [Methylobacterium durans]|uniref:Uncharacterized protein n=1 Tax=Methylobacterium durans TaxID=2202825 RepID=A0A2U8WBB2_9HYPH|nr:hypothetical protein [Methylobacterium durans]AWN42596.1 hypothetical protein DK389_21445 [Methylobacterium durans]